MDNQYTVFVFTSIFLFYNEYLVSHFIIWLALTKKNYFFIKYKQYLFCLPIKKIFENKYIAYKFIFHILKINLKS
jgi:hypothetical protein